MDRSQPTELYRYFTDDELLYVGVSISSVRRAAEHRRSSGWWNEANRMTIERHATRDLALEAERRAIRDECPRYNVVHAQHGPVDQAELDRFLARMKRERAEQGLPEKIDLEHLAATRGIRFVGREVTDAIAAVLWPDTA